MYNIAFVNYSPLTFTISDGSRIEPGGKWQSPFKLGNAWLKSDQMGTVNFLDIGDQHIPGDSKETWGVLISYQNEKWVGRYEGEGQLHVRFTKYMQVDVGGMDLRQVSLPGLQIG